MSGIKRGVASLFSSFFGVLSLIAVALACIVAIGFLLGTSVFAFMLSTVGVPAIIIGIAAVSLIISRSFDLISNNLARKDLVLNAAKFTTHNLVDNLQCTATEEKDRLILMLETIDNPKDLAKFIKDNALLEGKHIPPELSQFQNKFGMKPSDLGNNIGGSKEV